MNQTLLHFLAGIGTLSIVALVGYGVRYVLILRHRHHRRAAPRVPAFDVNQMLMQPLIRKPVAKSALPDDWITAKDFRGNWDVKPRHQELGTVPDSLKKYLPDDLKFDTTPTK